MILGVQQRYLATGLAMESEAIEKDMTAVSREPYDSQCDVFLSRH